MSHNKQQSHKGHRDKFQDRHPSKKNTYEGKEIQTENKAIQMFRDNLEACFNYVDFEKYFTNIVEDDEHRESEHFIVKFLRMDIVSKDDADLDGDDIYEGEPISFFAKSQEHAFLKYIKMLNDKYQNKYDIIGFFADLASIGYQPDEMSDRELHKDYKEFYNSLSKDEKKDARLNSMDTIIYFASEKIIEEWKNLCLDESDSDYEKGDADTDSDIAEGEHEFD